MRSRRSFSPFPVPPRIFGSISEASSRDYDTQNYSDMARLMFAICFTSSQHTGVHMPTTHAYWTHTYLEDFCLRQGYIRLVLFYTGLHSSSELET